MFKSLEQNPSEKVGKNHVPVNQQHNLILSYSSPTQPQQDNDISKSKVRYYSNSLQHRVKNRVWQTLLLLLPKLREVRWYESDWKITQEITAERETSFSLFLFLCMQEFVSSLLNRVFQAGFCSNQASVKYLIEWMMILILIHYPQHIDSFWNCFSMVSSPTLSESRSKQSYILSQPISASDAGSWTDQDERLHLPVSPGTFQCHCSTS